MQPETLTRQTLWGMGLSRYQATALTQSLQPIGKQNNAWVYDLPSVLAAAREYLSRRIQPKTRELVLALIEQLQTMLGNLLPLVSGGNDSAIRKAAIRLTQAMAKTDATQAKLKARAQRIQREQALCP